MNRTRLRGPALCWLLASFCLPCLWSPAAVPPIPQTITTAGDATPLVDEQGMPIAPPNMMYAGRTSTGSITINGSSPASFGTIYLGASGPLGTALDTAVGTLSVTGGAIGISNLIAGGPGTGNATYTNSTVSAGPLAISGPDSTLTLSGSTLNSGNTVSLSLGATFTATNSSFRGRLDVGSGSTASFTNCVVGDPVNYANLSVAVQGSSADIGLLTLFSGTTANVGSVLVGAAVSGPSETAYLLINDTAEFTAANLTIGSADSLFDPVSGSGQVKVDGPDARLTVRTRLDVGSTFTARLELRHGAHATASQLQVGGTDFGAVARDVVLREGSLLTATASTDVRLGTIAISELAKLDTLGPVHIGTEPSGPGQINLNGGVFAATGVVTIGYGGPGQIHAFDPSQALKGSNAAQLDEVRIGASIGGRTGVGLLEVSDYGAVATGLLTIGNNGGSGTLRILSQGTLNSASALLVTTTGTANTGLYSRATLSGVAAVWSVQQLQIGSSASNGPAFLEVKDGAVLFTNTTQVSKTGNTVTLDQGNWFSFGRIDVGGAGATAGGAVVLKNGGQLSAPEMVLGLADSAEASFGTLEVQAFSNVQISGLFRVGAAESGFGGGGHGQIALSGGTLSTNGGARIGEAPDSAGLKSSVTLSAGGAWNGDGATLIGAGRGKGTVTVGAGCNVSLAGTTVVGDDSNFGLSGGLVTLNGTWTNTGRLTVGRRAAGTFDVAGGTLVTHGGTLIAEFAGSFQAGMFVQSGGSWTEDGEVEIGRAGDALVSVSGGTVTVQGRTLIGTRYDSLPPLAPKGELKLRLGSSWTTNGDLQVGGRGSGFVNITESSALTSYVGTSKDGFAGSIGAETGGFGSVFVTGDLAPNSRWSMPDGALAVGLAGNGSLNVYSRGEVSNGDGYVGLLSGGTGTVTMIAGTWENRGALTVGGAGSGAVDVALKAILRSASGALGKQVGGNGSVVVEDADSKWIVTGDVTVGGLGTGTLALRKAGRLEVAELFLDPNGRLDQSDGVIAGSVRVRGGMLGPAVAHRRGRLPQGAEPPPSLLITGTLINDAGSTVLANAASTLTVGGCVTNDGLMIIAGGANLIATGECFTNNGILDLIGAGGFSPGENFVNNGTVLDASVVKVKTTVKSGNTVIVTIDGYTGHTYRLQHCPDLAAATFEDVGSSQQGVTGQVLSFEDTTADGVQGFYRVAVD